MRTKLSSNDQCELVPYIQTQLCGLAEEQNTWRLWCRVKSTSCIFSEERKKVPSWTSMCGRGRGPQWQNGVEFTTFIIFLRLNSILRKKSISMWKVNFGKKRVNFGEKKSILEKTINFEEKKSILGKKSQFWKKQLISRKKVNCGEKKKKLILRWKVNFKVKSQLWGKKSRFWEKQLILRKKSQFWGKKVNSERKVITFWMRK